MCPFSIQAYTALHNLYIYTPNLLSLCITRITVHAMHKYGSRVLSSRTHRCLCSRHNRSSEYVSCPFIPSPLGIVAFKENGYNNCHPLFCSTIGEDYELLNAIAKLIPLCFLLYASWSSHCLTAPQFTNIILSLRKPLHALFTILQSTQNHLHYPELHIA